MSGLKHRINPPSTTTQQPTSTITMPPEALFTGGLGSSMTLLSNFLSENLSSGGSDFRGSFTQLLALNSPGSDAAAFGFLGLGDTSEPAGLKTDGTPGSTSVPAFKQNRPASLMVPVPNSPLIQISPAGFSPSAFLNSPAGGFLSPATLSPYGMSHQQALAQVTANAAAALSQSMYPSSSSSSSITTAQPFVLDASASNLKLLDQIIIPQQQQQQLEASHHHNKRTATTNNNQNQNTSAVFPAPVDKPADDGYNWRKYGQKQVKGSEYPRSYYKCTHPSCPVKKKVERSKDGHITEIIYKGQHNHDKPPPGRRSAVTKDDDDDHDHDQNQNEIGIGFANQRPTNGAGLRLGMELLDHEDAAQATSLHLNGPSDSEESGEAPHRRGREDDEDERSTKKRNTGGGGTTSDAAAFSHRTVTEPKIVVQTRSKVDLLDDGYKWRKYGQKVVKGNPNPRSYYKCTTPDCGVRKHVERSSTDPEAVITTYEGKHNHDVPVAKNSSYNNNNNASGGQRTRATMNNNNNINIDFGNREQRVPPVAFLKLKQEQLQH